MSIYIEKDKVLKIVNDMTECEDDYERITEWVHNMPSIDIVRCKECRHKYQEPWHNGVKVEGECEIWHNATLDDDYCSYGERKNDE